ncbi:sporulation protein [Rivihabitans pingtungensis]|jgi:sporulation-control protein|uniref:sporulation protein n=3 Tax=Rivihabitans pingtungensis TaxID=1054498 RepID=UPI00289F010F|nr:sporulation protein [Rivihabitans pingtungensis]HNX71201.1 sporulation protein [Rivihabitans pingtungensis]
MLKKLLASIGVGSAQVDTQIDNPELAPGQLLQGQVLVQGGQSAQDIEKIELVLMTQAEDESQDSERTVAWPLCRLPVCGPFTIGAGETRYFPFQMTLPLETPVNALRTRDRRVPLVWIHTDLAIAAGVDSDDRDQLLVRPGMALQTLLDAFARLDWYVHSSDVELGSARVGPISSTLGCYQEIELRPHGGSWRIEEIELTCLCDGHHTHVLIEVDHRLGGDHFYSLVMGPDFARRDWVAILRDTLPL